MALTAVTPSMGQALPYWRGGGPRGAPASAGSEVPAAQYTALRRTWLRRCREIHRLSPNASQSRPRGFRGQSPRIHPPQNTIDVRLSDRFLSSSLRDQRVWARSDLALTAVTPSMGLALPYWRGGGPRGAPASAGSEVPAAQYTALRRTWRFHQREAAFLPTQHIAISRSGVPGAEPPDFLKLLSGCSSPP